MIFSCREKIQLLVTCQRAWANKKSESWTGTMMLPSSDTNYKLQYIAICNLSHFPAVPDVPERKPKILIKRRPHFLWSSLLYTNDVIKNETMIFRRGFTEKAGKYSTSGRPFDRGRHVVRLYRRTSHICALEPCR